MLGQRKSPRRRLRELLDGDDLISVPGCYDSLSGRIAEVAGFPAVMMSGSGTSASLIGRPDVGLLTQTEMIDNARRIAQAVDIPVVADADTGYGPALNVVRTVRDYEQAGVAGIQMEDQVTPKKCGFFAKTSVVSADEMSGKLQAAAEARNDPDFVVIARTDSAAIEGINAAIARGKQYLEAGADALLIEGISRRDDIEAVSLAFRGDRLVLNWAEIGREPDVSITEIASLGFRLLLFPGSTLYAASEAMRRILQVIREDGTPQRALSSTTGLAEFMELIGLPEAQGIEDRFNR